MRFALLLFAAALLALSHPAALNAADPEFVSLFDGKTLNGWKVIGCEAEVKDGAVLLKDGNGVVASEEQYDDFILEFEWKALRPEKYDSGVYFRCELPKGGRPWPQRYQINLLKGQEGNLVGGPPATRSEGLVKAGDWNKFRFTVKGQSATLEINGKAAWSADGVIKVPTGHICLQSEVAGGGQFLFRAIRIAELKKDDKGAAGEAPSALSRQEIDQRAAVIRPSAAELKWKQVPWLTDLGDAQKAAIRERRPLFVWVTGDDPMGRC